MGVLLSPKYGVNPSLGVCFFCKQDTGEIALLGRLKGDIEAPRKIIMNKIPCDKCEEGMKQGITIFACDDNKEPTGTFVVLKEESIDNIFDPETAITLKKTKKGMMPLSAYKRVFDDAVNEMNGQ